jgi:hypothetical protein
LNSLVRLLSLFVVHCSICTTVPNAYFVILASCLKESYLPTRHDCATLVLRAAFACVIVYLDAKFCSSALLRR